VNGCIKIVVRATGLYKAAKERRIEVPQSSDATNITKNVSFIIYGIKIKDRAAVCPIMKRPLNIPANNGKSAQTSIQSYENCIHVKIIIGKETKDVVYVQLKANFYELAKEDRFGEDNNSSILGEGFKPLISPCDADKKMHWAGLGSGGTAKVYKLPCTCCAIKSEDLAMPNSTHCKRWCDQWRLDGKLAAYPNWKCYHKPMITTQQIAKIRDESEQIEHQLFGHLVGKMELLVDHLKLDCSKDPRGIGQGNAIHDMASIHFDTIRSNQTDQNTYLMSLANTFNCWRDGFSVVSFR
jgi:hypothetical protein